MKKLFSRVVSDSGLSKKDRAGLSLERLAEYAAGGKTLPREDYSFDISRADYPVFPESPSAETALVFGDGFAVRVGRNLPSQAGIPAEAAVLVFPQPDSDPYGFLSSAVSFAAEAAASGTCRTVPCGRRGLVFDLFRACGSFTLHTRELPGEPEYPEAALASFAPAFLIVCRSRDAVRGIEGFSHLWLIWEFTLARRSGAALTVRPPRLGGNERVGVFASRSPFRPNGLGLSCVRLLRVDYDDPCGPVLAVGGADLLNGTPVYDVKPYLPFTDCVPDAVGGFADAVAGCGLSVRFAADTAA
ncbi:MAG: tRNA (N6-threonylcarbamoyladenosine(37)-N6)-methyltransferase TrmO, partial [Clostridia bacterium]|nr:tRNA (N6-threonylcarbamoyladenosine(37)-N6)-methyltransferase TrmO [Clostridia bacterium]